MGIAKINLQNGIGSGCLVGNKKGRPKAALGCP